MGELILCRQPLAATPYYIENAMLNVYSLEELSWYIYHNTETIDDDFISEQMIVWIDEVLNFPALADRLRSLKQSGMPLYAQVEALLSSCGYLTPKEIRETVQDIMHYADLTPEERKKRRADQLMNDGKPRRALLIYQELLSDPDINRSFYGNVCHNTGYAYASLFMFREAAEYYRKAYEHNTGSRSLSQLLFCLMELHDDKAINDVVENYHIRAEQLEMAEKVFEAANNSSEVQEAIKQAQDSPEKSYTHLKDDYIRKYGA